MVKNQNCFTTYIKTDDIYKDIVEDVETRLDSWNYELERSKFCSDHCLNEKIRR